MKLLSSGGEIQACAVGFDRVDGIAGASTTLAVFLIYCSFLRLDVGLGMPALFSTGGYYAGVPHPPGFPLWTWYAWLFSNGIPFSNVAWRVALSSALAGAATCGLVALMVSRVGALMLPLISVYRAIPREILMIRFGCGCIAGAVLGFSREFCRKSTEADPWPLSLLLFAMVLCLLFRWMLQPSGNRYLWAACISYGLALTNSQALLAAAPGLAIGVCLGDKRKGRDLLIVASLFALTWWAVCRKGDHYDFRQFAGLTTLELIAAGAVCSTLAAVTLVCLTQTALTEWRCIVVACLCLGAGLLPYGIPPVSSMTNPPINWGYPRVVEGFKHTLTRSHYERVSTVDNLADYVRQVGTCVSVSSSGFGWNGTVIGAAAALGFFIIRGAALRWLLGLLVLHLTMGLLLTAILSPWKSIESVRAVAPYLTATHLPLAILVGAGLMLLAACCLGIRERRLRSEATVDADEPRPSAAL